MTRLTTRDARARRRRRVRGKVSGTAERPRLAVFRSNVGIYAQLVDDLDGKTLASASSKGLPKSFKGTKTARRTRSASSWPRLRSRRASRRACSTVPATCTTDA